MTVNVSVSVSRTDDNKMRMWLEAVSLDRAEGSVSLDFTCAGQAFRAARDALMSGIREAARLSEDVLSRRSGWRFPAGRSNEALAAGLDRIATFASSARMYLSSDDDGELGRELRAFVERVIHDDIRTIELRCHEDHWLPIGLLLVSKSRHRKEKPATHVELLSMAATPVAWVRPGDVNSGTQHMPPFPWRVVGVWTPSLRRAKREVIDLDARPQFSVSQLAHLRQRGDAHSTVVARAVASGTTHQLLHLACHLRNGGGLGIHNDVLHVCDPKNESRTIEVGIADVTAALVDLGDFDPSAVRCSLVVANVCSALGAPRIRWMLAMLASPGGTLVGPFDQIKDVVASKWSKLFYNGVAEHLSVSESLRDATWALLAQGTFEALLYSIAGDGRLRAAK